MANSEYPKQPPTPEQSRSAEQVPKNDTGDLALLAEFQAVKMSKAVQTATEPAIRERRQKDANEMAGAHRRIADLVSGYKTAQEAIQALDELEQSWTEELMKPALAQEATEEEIDIALAEIRRARTLIEQNQNTDLYSRKDFSDWLKARNARVREKRQATDKAREQKSRQQAAEQIDAIRENLGIKKPKVEGLAINDIDTQFSDPNIKTIEQIKGLVTPEVKAGLLDHILKAVDTRIEQGKRLAAKESGAAVEARNMATVLGQEAIGRRYQFIASAGEGKIINAQNVGTMSMDNFLKKYLDYDLRSDTQRKADLEKFTNMLD